MIYLFIYLDGYGGIQVDRSYKELEISDLQIYKG